MTTIPIGDLTANDLYLDITTPSGDGDYGGQVRGQLLRVQHGQHREGQRVVRTTSLDILVHDNRVAFEMDSLLTVDIVRP